MATSVLVGFLVVGPYATSPTSAINLPFLSKTPRTRTGAFLSGLSRKTFSERITNPSDWGNCPGLSGYHSNWHPPRGQ